MFNLSETIKLARYRHTPYYVRCTVNGGEKKYVWAGSKNNRAEIKEVPKEVVDYLLINSTCFDKGELVILEDNEHAKEAVDNITEKEKYKNNSHSREEIEKLLKGNINKMKSELNKIDVDSEKQFVLEIAKDMKDDLTNGKVQFLADWLNVPMDLLFD